MVTPGEVPAAGITRSTATLSTSPCSHRQLFAGLLLDDVLGVPVRPVGIVLAAVALLVLAMGGGSAAQRRRKFSLRAECRVALYASGQPRGDFLEQPAVAVGIPERGVGLVAAARRIEAVAADGAEQIGRVGSDVLVARGMEDLPDLDPARDQILARSLDVGNDQIESLRGAGRR